jgi:hypothetical protein
MKFVTMAGRTVSRCPGDNARQLILEVAGRPRHDEGDRAGRQKAAPAVANAKRRARQQNIQSNLRMTYLLLRRQDAAFP